MATETAIEGEKEDEEGVEKLEVHSGGMKKEKTPPPIAATLAWLRENLEHREGVSTPRLLVYHAYAQYCLHAGLSAVTPQFFGRLLRQVFPGVTMRRLGPRSHSVFHYLSLALRVAPRKRPPREHQLIPILPLLPPSIPEVETAHVADINAHYKPFVVPDLNYKHVPSLAAHPHMELFASLYTSNRHYLSVLLINRELPAVSSCMRQFWEGLSCEMVDLLNREDVCFLLEHYDKTFLGKLVEHIFTDPVAEAQIPLKDVCIYRDYYVAAESRFINSLRSAPLNFILRRMQFLKDWLVVPVILRTSLVLATTQLRELIRSPLRVANVLTAWGVVQRHVDLTGSHASSPHTPSPPTTPSAPMPSPLPSAFDPQLAALVVQQLSTTLARTAPLLTSNLPLSQIVVHDATRWMDAFYAQQPAATIGEVLARWNAVFCYLIDCVIGSAPLFDNASQVTDLVIFLEFHRQYMNFLIDRKERLPFLAE